MQRTIKNTIHHFSIRYLNTIILCIIMATAIACKSPDDALISVNTPTVSSVYPVDSSTDVAINVNLSVTFDETMDPASILLNTTNTTCSQTIQISSNSFSSCVLLTSPTPPETPFRNYTFQAASNLQPNTLYKVKVTTQARDHAGETLSIDYVTPNGFTTSGPSVSSLVVSPHYSSSGSKWNDYVKNDGADFYTATDTACNSATDSSCLHGGVMRSIEVPGKSTCAGLTYADSLDVFNWICSESTDPVRMISFGFKNGKGLPDLIDFSATKWQPINFTVWDNNVTYNSSGLTTWWSNAVVQNNDGSDGSDMNVGEIHIITANPQAVYTIGADKVALVIQPGVTMTGSVATNETLITANSRSFVWIEGGLDAAGDDKGISFSTTKFSVLDDVTVTNANSNGIELLSNSNNNLLRGITSNSNTVGIQLTGSSYNELTRIWANTNTNIGINSSTSAVGYRFSHISAANNTNSGIVISPCTDCILNNITASGNAGSFGLSFQGSSHNNLFINITAYNNSHGVLHKSSPDFSTVQNIASANNANKGLDLYQSLNNYFTGKVRIGSNTVVNCDDDDNGNDGGLTEPTCANNGSSDANVNTSTNLSSSFNGTGWELLSTDTEIRNVLSLPSGNDTVTHTWSGAGTSTLLRNAVEIRDDGIGNDNLLCESGETCLYTPNIGRYQGHGNLINAGTIGTGGTLENIILLQYETNGY